jgi:hypothetical protein
MLALGCVPGGFGEWLYRRIVGFDQNEKQIYAAVRLVGFSVVGLCLYTLTCVWGSPLPVYVYPKGVAALTPAGFPAVAAAFFGHCLGGALSGVAGGWATRLSAPLFHSSAHESWDCFVRHYVKNRWVIVDLDNGQRYAGMVQNADVSANPAERDIVHCEPAPFNSETGEYVATPYEYMYIPAKMLSSVGALSVDQDKRVSNIGVSIFHTEPSHVAERRPEQPTAVAAAAIAGVGSTTQAGPLATHAAAASAKEIDDQLKS